MEINSDKLKNFILDSGLIGKPDLEEAHLKAQKEDRSLGDILVSEGKISEDDIRRIEAHVLGIPFVDLRNEKIDFKILSLIPEPIARTHNIVAFSKSNRELEVAMLDPEDLETIDFIKKKSRLKILPRLTSPESIKFTLAQYQKSLKEEFGDIINKEAGALEVVDDDSKGKKDLKKLGEDLPVVKIVDTLLRHAILERASDIHIEPTEDEVLIRYRIDGILHDTMTLPKKVADGLIARIKILSSLRLDEKRLPQDGRFKIKMGEESISFRVSTLPVYNGEKAVLRLLRSGSAGGTLESLGISSWALEKINKAINRPNGLVLVTGPTGSGKTTTLYTFINILNTPEVNISTIEDPIEYQISRINQSQVKPEIGFTFSNGLRTLLRQDPDIIMVGEIRDNETASLAINASLTGHLVFSTLHTNSSAGAIPRLVDMKAEPFLLVTTISVIVAQRLIRKLDKNKEKYFLDNTQLKDLGKIIDLDKILKFLKDEKVIDPGKNWKNIPFYKPKGSNDNPDGYHGRAGIYEVLTMSEPIKKLIIGGATAGDIEAQAKKEGMIAMVEDGIVKAVSGLTSLEEILRVTRE